MSTKERPILFSGPMVRAILEGRKTQTRRVVKPQPPSWLHVYSVGIAGGVASFVGHGRSEQFADSSTAKCPYGVVGDRLWVRESWQHTVAADGDCCVAYRADDSARYSLADQCGEGDFIGLGTECNAVLKAKWRPSTHMPRWASRITLEITSVRVERLNEITPSDAVCEGIDFLSIGGVGEVDVFAGLWESINGDGSWEANPWVWVVEFRRI